MTRPKLNPAPRIGAALRKAREAKSIGVSEQAKRLGVTRDTIYHLEEGLWKLHSFRYVHVGRIRYAYGEEASQALVDALDDLVSMCKASSYSSLASA